MEITNAEIRASYSELHSAAESANLALPNSVYRSMIFDVIRKLMLMSFSADPSTARKLSRKLALEHETYLNSLGIQIILEGYEDNEFADNSRLEVSNHPHTLEALTAYARLSEDMASRTTAVINSADCQYPLRIGKGLRVLDPIQVFRPKKVSRESVSSCRSAVDSKVLETILEGDRVLVFLEGTRSRGGGIRKLQPDLIRNTVLELQNNPALESKIVVKTACPIGAIPMRYEDGVKFKRDRKAFKMPIYYFREVLDIGGMSLDSIIKEIEKIQRRNIKSSLSKSFSLLNR